MPASQDGRLPNWNVVLGLEPASGFQYGTVASFELFHSQYPSVISFLAGRGAGYLGFLAAAGFSVALVSGGAAPAQAIVYTFSDTQVSFPISGFGTLDATITGSFNYNTGSSTFTDVNVVFDETQFTTIDVTFTQGGVVNNGVNSYIYFVNPSTSSNTNCTQSPADPPTNARPECLRLNLSGPLTGVP